MAVTADTNRHSSRLPPPTVGRGSGVPRNHLCHGCGTAQAHPKGAPAGPWRLPALASPTRLAGLEATAAHWSLVCAAAASPPPAAGDGAPHQGPECVPARGARWWRPPDADTQHALASSARVPLALCHSLTVAEPALLASRRPAAVPGISAAPFEDNLRYFNVIVEGPPGTAFESACPAAATGGQAAAGLHWRAAHAHAAGLTAASPSCSHRHCSTLADGAFKLELYCPDDYPMCPPKVRPLPPACHRRLEYASAGRGRLCHESCAPGPSRLRRRRPLHCPPPPAPPHRSGS